MGHCSSCGRVGCKKLAAVARRPAVAPAAGSRLRPHQTFLDIGCEPPYHLLPRPWRVRRQRIWPSALHPCASPVLRVGASASIQSALCAATDELRCGAPGVMRKRVETSHRVDANDRLACSQRSIRDRAQRRTAMGALQFVQCIRIVLQSNEGLRGRCHGSIECAVGRCRRLAPRLDLAGVVASGRRRGDFTSDRGCASHRLRAQLRGAEIVWSAVRRAEFGLLTRCLGEPRRVLERVQRARESPLLVLRFGRAVHIRHECLRPAQRIGRLRH